MPPARWSGRCATWPIWAQALHHGKVLKPASYAHDDRADDAERRHETTLMVSACRTAPCAGMATIEHSGGIFGGNTDSLYIPAQDMFVAVFANSDRPAAGSPGIVDAPHRRAGRGHAVPRVHGSAGRT